MTASQHKKLLRQLSGKIPAKQIIQNELLTYAYSVDASFYRLVPEMIIVVENEREAIDVISACHKSAVPFTFRAAGTSLSGQALSDSVLIKLGPGWNKITIEENGMVVKLQPGVTGGEVNRRLLPYNKKLGPDPASANVAKIGGILANNASGMTSGVIHNSYNTLMSMRIVFYDGSVLDSADSQSVEQFKTRHPEICDALIALAESVKKDQKLSDRILAKYKMKNTCGYGLNSLIDFSAVEDIITHLMVGSEGTLGFISQVTMKTVDNFPHKATTFLLFKNIAEACETIPVLEKEKVDCSELMDNVALESIKDLPGMPFDSSLLTNETAALLVEISAESEQRLKSSQDALAKKLATFSLVNEARFTYDPLERARVWKARKGLFPTGCKTRQKGTTVIIEDINFPVKKLAGAVTDIQSLLKDFGYNNSFIWGHALAGNIHFVLTQKFDSTEKINTYNDFMQQLAKLVIESYDGSLKAEHGTGRNMAPFVAYEWGPQGYAVMQQVKNILDPQNIINPGVLLNDDPLVHLKSIKSINEVHDTIDMCTECGFCEKICPSKDFTITPRQRISLFRKELSKDHFDGKALKKLSKKFKFNVDQTCAADGMCQTECPVDINVGDIIKEVRTLQKSPLNNLLATFIARYFKGVINTLRLVFKTIEIPKGIIGETTFIAITEFMSKLSFGFIPAWQPALPKAAKKIRLVESNNRQEVLYFPSCINRLFASYPNNAQKELPGTIQSVLQKADLDMKVLSNSESLCCGMAFASKGYRKQSLQMSEKLYTAIKTQSTAGSGPVLFDTSPCAIHFQEYLIAHNKLDIEIYDPVDFIYDYLQDKVNFERIPQTIALHPVCSIKKQNTADKLQHIAGLCSEKVILTEPVGCCGFAGDKGIQLPGLKKSALAELPYDQIGDCQSGYSSSRMCEIGLSGESGLPFNSIFYLLDKSIKQ